MTISARGHFGTSERITSNAASEPAPTTSVAAFVCGSSLMVPPQLLHIGAGRCVYPEQLVRLVDDDPDREPENEARHHGLREKRRDPAHPQHPTGDADNGGR